MFVSRVSHCDQEVCAFLHYLALNQTLDNPLLVEHLQVWEISTLCDALRYLLALLTNHHYVTQSLGFCIKRQYHQITQTVKVTCFLFLPVSPFLFLLFSFFMSPLFWCVFLCVNLSPSCFAYMRIFSTITSSPKNVTGTKTSTQSLLVPPPILTLVCPEEVISGGKL